MLDIKEKEQILKSDPFINFQDMCNEFYELTKTEFENLLNYISSINKGIKEIIENSLMDRFSVGEYDFSKLDGDAKNIFKVATISVYDIFKKGEFVENEYGHLVLKDEIKISENVIVLPGFMFELESAEGDTNNCETDPVGYFSLRGKIKLDGEEYSVTSDKEYVLKIYYCGGPIETFNNDKIKIYN